MDNDSLPENSETVCERCGHRNASWAMLCFQCGNTLPQKRRSIEVDDPDDDQAAYFLPPLLGIWFSPTLTIRTLLTDRKRMSNYRLFLMTIIGTLPLPILCASLPGHSLAEAMSTGIFGVKLAEALRSMTLEIRILVGTLFVVFTTLFHLYIWSGLVHLFCLFTSTTDAIWKETRAAMVYGSIPGFVGAWLTVPGMWLLLRDYPLGSIEDAPTSIKVTIGLLIILMGSFGLWAAIAQLRGLAETHGLTLWQTIKAMLKMSVVVYGVYYLFLFLVHYDQIAEFILEARGVRVRR